MKKFIVAIVILGLVATGAYAGFGMLARQNVMTGLESIQKQLPGVIERDIKGGLLQSQVHARIPLPHLAEIDRNAALVIDETIYHGPFIFSGAEKGVPRIMAQAYGTGTIALELPGVELSSQVKELLRAHLNLRVPLVGASALTVAGQPLQHSVDLGNGNQLQVDWQGFALDMTFTGNSLLNYTLALNAPGLLLQGNGGDLIALRQISVSGAMSESVSGLSVGTLQSGLAEMEVRLVAQDDHILAKGLSGTISSTEEKGMLSLAEKFVMTSLAFDDQDFSDLQFRLALRNLPAQTMVDLGHAIQAIEADPAAQNDPQLAQQQAQDVIGRLGPALLAGSPELALEEISFVMPQGKVQFHGALRFNGAGQVLLNPIFLLGRLSAEGFFEADKAALEEIVRENVKWGSCPDSQDLACANQALDTAIAKLADYVASGMLVRNPTTYSYTMSFKDGQIMVNGKPQPLPLGNLGS